MAEVTDLPGNGAQFRFWRAEPPWDAQPPLYPDIFAGESDGFDLAKMGTPAADIPVTRRVDSLSVNLQSAQGYLRAACRARHDLYFSFSELSRAVRVAKASGKRQTVLGLTSESALRQNAR